MIKSSDTNCRYCTSPPPASQILFKWIDLQFQLSNVDPCVLVSRVREEHQVTRGRTESWGLRWVSSKQSLLWIIYFGWNWKSNIEWMSIYLLFRDNVERMAILERLVLQVNWDLLDRLGSREFPAQRSHFNLLIILFWLHLLHLL